MIEASRAGTSAPLARFARLTTQASAIRRRASLPACQRNAGVAGGDRFARSGKERVDGVDHGCGRLGPPLRGGKSLDILGVRKIAELNEHGWKFRRPQNDEACGALRVAIELRRAAQALNEAARENMGVSARLPALEVEQNVSDIRIIEPLASTRPAAGGILACGDASRFCVGSAVGRGIDCGAADVGRLTQYVGMDGDEQRRVRGAGDLDAIVEIDILVAVARHHNAVAPCRVELSLQFGAEFIDERLFLNAAEAPGAAVGAAVAWIEDNDRRRNGGRGAWG